MSKNLMLNKEVCIECINKRYALTAQSIWHEGDENIWDKGEVICCGGGGEEEHRVSIKDPPPEHCEYAFQHAVAAGMADVE